MGLEQGADHSVQECVKESPLMMLSRYSKDAGMNERTISNIRSTRCAQFWCLRLRSDLQICTLDCDAASTCSVSKRLHHISCTVIFRRILLYRSCVSEDTLLEIHYYRFLNHCSSSFLKSLMCRVFLHVIVSLFICVESKDESVAHSILLAHVRSLYCWSQGLGYLQALNRSIFSTSNRQNVRSARVWMNTQFLQAKEPRRDLQGVMAVRDVFWSVLRTSLTTSAFVVSLKWNRTTCVVYGMSGAWLPKR